MISRLLTDFFPKHDILFTDIQFYFNEADETQTCFIPPKKPVAAFFFVLHKVSISIVLNLWTLIGRGASQEIGAIFQDPAEQNSRGKGILLLALITFSDITVY